jgi:hypothetical protein
MKNWIIGLVAGMIVVTASLPALAAAVSSDDSGRGAGKAAASARHSAHREANGKAVPPERSDRDDAGKDQDHGPPSWAHGPNSKHEKPLGAAWKTLNPRQRAAKMVRLAREHAAGMVKWAECVAADRDQCARPLPPGLAKRAPR